MSCPAAISDRGNPSIHALEGDERIRTAVCALGADLAVRTPEHRQ